jgi:CRP/FNR family transcriptional regulator
MIDNKLLKNLPLFSELNETELSEISSFSKLIKYKKNSNIFFDTDLFIGFYIVIKGRVKIYKVSDAGKETILHFAEELESFADVPLFEEMKYYPVNALTVEDSVLFFIPKYEFISFLGQHPKVGLKIISGFAKKLKLLTSRIESLTLSEVTPRLAKYILSEYLLSNDKKPNNPQIKLKITKSNLASFLGTITETLSRTFKKLHNDGIINVRGKNIFITDLVQLKKLAAKDKN